MTLVRVLVILASFLFASHVSAAVVSGEITTRSTPKTTMSKVTPVKKIVLRTTTKTVLYTSPAGKESMRFTIKHRDGIIVSVTARANATNKISRTLQNNFAKNISKAVV